MQTTVNYEIDNFNTESFTAAEDCQFTPLEFISWDRPREKFELKFSKGEKITLAFLRSMNGSKSAAEYYVLIKTDMDSTSHIVHYTSNSSLNKQIKEALRNGKLN